MPQNDAWDWPLLLYVCTVILHRSERQFWRMLPRKLWALSNVHTELNSGSDKDKAKEEIGYIDNIM